MRKLLLCSVMLFVIGIADAQIDSAKFYAGFRASRVLSSYPNNQFPKTEYWIRVAKEMVQKFPGSTPAGIWILSLYQGAGVTQLSFPNNGVSVPNIQFTGTDYNESHLSALDTSGVKVWLQVEPGAASMDTLISIVLNRYKHHPCVIGFGVDVEWFFANTNSGGRKLTDSMVQRWEQKVQAIDPSYSLFIKHYAQSWMPPTYRGKVLFVDDSQDFTFSGAPFNAMVSEFTAWGTKFAPARSAFQFGYKADSVWWRQLSDPPKAIGDALRSKISTCAAVFWVDFTITKVFPYTSVSMDEVVPERFALSLNYPNPFNPATTIQYSIPEHLPGFKNPEGVLVTIKIYDISGKEIATLVNEQKMPGVYTVRFDASPFPSGTYLYQLRSGSTVISKKMLLLK